MVLVRDVPLDRSIGDVVWDQSTIDVDEVRRLFEFLEFNTLFDRLAEALDTDLGPAASEAEVLEAEVDVARRRRDGRQGRSPGSPGRGRRSRWRRRGRASKAGPTSRAWPSCATAPPATSCGSRVTLLADAGVRAELGALAGLDGRPLAAHQAKPIVRALTSLDVDVRSLALDTALAAYLLDPAESRYLLEELVVRYAGARIPDGDAAAEGQLDLEGSATPTSTTTGRRALAVDRLVAPLLAALDAQGLRALNDDIEVPLVGVLARMEDAGVAVDRDELAAPPRSARRRRRAPPRRRSSRRPATTST